MNSARPIIQKLNKQEPIISPKPALKLPRLHNDNVETSSGREVATAKKIAHPTVELKAK